MKKKFVNSFKNKVSRVEHTDRMTDGMTDRLTLNFINIDGKSPTVQFFKLNLKYCIYATLGEKGLKSIM